MIQSKGTVINQLYCSYRVQRYSSSNSANPLYIMKEGRRKIDSQLMQKIVYHTIIVLYINGGTSSDSYLYIYIIIFFLFQPDRGSTHVHGSRVVRQRLFSQYEHSVTVVRFSEASQTLRSFPQAGYLDRLSVTEQRPAFSPIVHFFMVFISPRVRF